MAKAYSVFYYIKQVFKVENLSTKKWLATSGIEQDQRRTSTTSEERRNTRPLEEERRKKKEKCSISEKNKQATTPENKVEAQDVRRWRCPYECSTRNNTRSTRRPQN